MRGCFPGNGAGIAGALGAEGATVIVNYSRSKPGADAVVASIEAAGGTAVAIRADMSNSTDVIRLFERVKADHGKVDVLVNNAGVAVFEMVADLTEEAFHKQFNLNVLGYFPAIREAVKLWKCRREHHQYQLDPEHRPLSGFQRLCRDERCDQYADVCLGPRARTQTHPGELDPAGSYKHARHRRQFCR